MLRECSSSTSFHMSHVTYQASHVTRQVSSVMCNFFLFKSGGAGQWRVCYQLGLPCFYHSIRKIQDEPKGTSHIFFVFHFSTLSTIFAILDTECRLINYMQITLKSMN